jgi:hypothetical protein
MSIERQYGKIIIVCDGCGEAYETETPDFQDALTSFKASGGKLSLVDQGKQRTWLHWCGDPCKPGDE